MHPSGTCIGFQVRGCTNIPVDISFLVSCTKPFVVCLFEIHACIDVFAVDDVGGQRFDVERMVTLDDAGGRPNALSLRFNLTDDPSAVARDFISRNDLRIDELETVRAFVMQERDKEAAARGIVIDTSASIMAAAAEAGKASSFAASSGGMASYRHFPLTAYATAASGVKVCMLGCCNGVILSDLSLDPVVFVRHRFLCKH